MRFVWKHLPQWVLSLPPVRELGTWIHRQVTRHQARSQSHSTWFMRNVPQLEVVRDLLREWPSSAPLQMASIGCSTGAELYSALFVIRSARRDLDVVACGVDISSGVVEAARAGRYHPAIPAAQAGLYDPGIPEVSDLSAELQAALFVEEDGYLTVRDWIREGVAWAVGDARGQSLLDLLEPQDIAIANNFLGPMSDADAEACLRNVVRIVRPGGYLVVDGVDLDLKTRVVRSLGLLPVCDRIEEVHSADPSKRDWPWTRWSHEPFDRRRPGWKIRYATVFRVPTEGEPADEGRGAV